MTRRMRGSTITRVAQVKALIDAHPAPTALSQREIATALGLEVGQVQRALLHLDAFDPDWVRSIPVWGNGYKVSSGWGREAKRGEAHIARYLATMMERFANRLEKAARRETDPATAAMMTSSAGFLRAQVTALRTLAGVMVV